MIEFFKDKKGDWRWRAKTANGRIVAEGGEGYRNWKDLRAGVCAAASVLLDKATELPLRAPKVPRAKKSK